MGHTPPKHRLVRLVHRRVIFTSGDDQSYFAATCGCGWEEQADTAAEARAGLDLHVQIGAVMASGKRKTSDREGLGRLLQS